MVIQRVGAYQHPNRTHCLIIGDHCRDTDDDGYCNKCGDSPVGDDFNDFVAMAAEVAATTAPKWRLGQAVFNTLHELRPRLANQIRGTNLDPFNNDDRLPAFYKHVEKNW